MDLVITQAPTPPADPTAVIGRRTVAWLIDFVVMAAIVIAVGALVGSSDERRSAIEAEAICDILNNTDTDYFCVNADTTVILFSDGDVGTLVLVLGVYTIFTQLLLPALTGFTPGKALVGLRVVDKETFEKAGFGGHLIRWLLWVVDSAPWCFPLVALITGLSSNGHRRVGDMAGGTLVIDKQWVGQPMAVGGVNSVAAVTAATGAPLFPPAAPPPMVRPQTPPPPPGATPPPPIAPMSTPPPIAPISTPPPPTPRPAAEPGRVDPVEEPDEVDIVDQTTVMPPIEEADETTALLAPTAPPAPTPPPTPPAPPVPPAPPTAPPAPTPAVTPGVDAPQWDAERDTYIQWDPELGEWMEWSEAGGAWVPISQ